MKLRLLFALFALLTTAMAGAVGTLTVTSPTEGAFLGGTNSLKFNITGAQVEVQVTVTVTGPGGTTTIGPQPFTPDTDGHITGIIPVNFSQSSPEGPYTIVVSATENGASYVPVTIHVTVDVTKPKFYDFNPIADSFVRGPNVPIVVKVIDANFKNYKVQVNGQDIPNNTGTTLDSDNTFTVPWNVTGILQDGAQSISIDVKDQADNDATQSFTVTIDRVAPTTTITYPRSDTRVRPHSTIPITVDINDSGQSNSVAVTGVDVVLQNMSGHLIMRVPRTSFQSNRWTGRILSSTNLPHQFKVVANTVDKAGNVGVTQTTVVTVG
ncbi:MAG TPA: hypothetical protein VHE55_18020 [Fimbriimonadaceae bacterium]|nr:hypothetical protein [Fimbriimonadaceae bacterium]